MDNNSNCSFSATEIQTQTAHRACKLIWYSASTHKHKVICSLQTSLDINFVLLPSNIHCSNGIGDPLLLQAGHKGYYKQSPEDKFYIIISLRFHFQIVMKQLQLVLVYLL